MAYFKDTFVWEPASSHYEFTAHAQMRLVGIFQGVMALVVLGTALFMPSRGEKPPILFMLPAILIFVAIAVGFLLYRSEFKADPILKRVEILRGIGPWLKFTQWSFNELTAVQLDGVTGKNNRMYLIKLAGPGKPLSLKSFAKPKDAAELAEKIAQVVDKPIEKTAYFQKYGDPKLG